MGRIADKINYTIMPKFELIRDWETPITKFHKGHFNTPSVWAEVLGISEKDFWTYVLSGKFLNWFKVYENDINND